MATPNTMTISLPGEGEQLFKLVRHKSVGSAIAAVLVLLVAAGVVAAFIFADIDYKVTAKYLFDPQILSGVVTTLELTVISMLVGLVLGVVTALLRESKNRVLSGAAGFYTWLFRGTPVLVQLLIWFNIALVIPTVSFFGLWPVSTNTIMTPFLAAILALGINEGSYMSEIVRAGLLAVDKGQGEAALALGMRKRRVMMSVVLPQALRVILPPAGNQLIAMLKTSALAYTISVSELLNGAFRIYTLNYKVIELLFTASIWYLFMTTVLTFLQSWLERRMNRGYAAQAASSMKKRWLKNTFGVTR